MKKNTIEQQHAKEESIEFVDFHRPVFEAGKYKLTVKQNVKAHNGFQQQSEIKEKAFIVSSPRFELPKNTIHSNFPPDNGSADYVGVVPSVSLRKATLPWERSPDKKSDTPDGAAWMALILVDESDFDQGRAIESYQDDKKTKFTLGKVENDLGIKNLQDWYAYQKDMPVGVLELETDFYRKVMPAYDDLQWLSHTRFSHSSKKEKKGELTTILGNRLPSPGRKNTVYLVSIEHRYETTKSKASEPSKNGMQRLIWLHKWEFQCEPSVMYAYTVTPEILLKAQEMFPDIALPEVVPDWLGHAFEGDEGRDDLKEILLKTHESHDPQGSNNPQGKEEFIKGITPEAANFILEKAKKAGGTFTDILKAVDATSFGERLPMGKKLPNAEAQELLETGRVVLKHHLRSGGKTYSWYKGPLSSAPEKDKGFKFPITSSDELLVFHRATGMLDTTYASAWNLGRTKGLEQKSVATDLFRWRHQQRQHLMHQQQGSDHSHLHVVVPQSEELPESVINKLNDFKVLKGIPANYLVPKPSMLPEESLRFFHVDTNWVRAFMDGYLSMGKVHGLDDSGEEYQNFPSFDHPVTGILLHSNVIAGWPALHVDAHDRVKQGKVSTKLLPVLRKVKLNQETLLILFAGIPQMIDIYLAPEALHSGFAYSRKGRKEGQNEGKSDRYYHTVTNPDTGEDFYGANKKLVEVDLFPKGNTNEKELLIFSPQEFQERLTTEINKQLKRKDANATNVELTPSSFGVELIEGTPMFRFELV